MTGDQNDWAREVFRNHDRRAEALETASVESGNLALRSLLLLNGGASIALLGFLASIFSSDTQQHANSEVLVAFLGALGKFAWGAALAVLAASLGYLTNSAYARSLMDRPKKWEWPYIEQTDSSKRTWSHGVWLNRLTIAACLGSLALFIWGCVEVGFAY
ncbi:MAG: hypothetical protein KF899_11855 [Parvibaculum sp.]|nr:hypothetical protein [Parvibaculum sp.]